MNRAEDRSGGFWAFRRFPGSPILSTVLHSPRYQRPSKKRQRTGLRQTSYNVKAEVIGGRSPGLTLTRLGTELATTAGKELRNSGLRFDRIFCSTAVRARQTLECMGLISVEETDAVVYSDCLEELSQGEWEGRPRREIYTPKVISCLNRENPFFRPPGGEE